MYGAMCLQNIPLAVIYRCGSVHSARACGAKVDQGLAAENWRVFAQFFREGIFIVYIPSQQYNATLLEFLSQRDAVIRDLMRKRLPVLTPLAVLVADLQNSVKICSELPPEEYFELINEIWTTMGPVFLLPARLDD